MELDTFKADGHVFCDAERASKIQVSLYGDLDAVGWYAHGRSHHLARDLGACRQCSKQKVTRAGTASSASDTLVRLGLVDGASDIDRTSYGGVGLPAFGPDGDFRRTRVVAVLLFQRLLQRSDVHVNLVLIFLSIVCRGGAQPRVLKRSHPLVRIYLHHGDGMPKFVIEREVPGAGNLTDAQLREMSQKSVSVLKGLGPEIQWLHSYVTGDKVYCVYIAPDEAIILEHARRVGIPANRVSAVRRLIDPTSAE